MDYCNKNLKFKILNKWEEALSTLSQNRVNTIKRYKTE